VTDFIENVKRKVSSLGYLAGIEITLVVSNWLLAEVFLYSLSSLVDRDLRVRFGNEFIKIDKLMQVERLINKNKRADSFYTFVTDILGVVFKSRC